MSGTDRTTQANWSPDGPTFVLVQPQMGENIGAAARGMWNFGLRRMAVVAPRDGWPNPAAVAMASGAGGLLDEAHIVATTDEAVAGAQVVYATTARPREMTKRVLTPEDAMAEARGIAAAGGRTAVLFGPERAGLANEDVVLADAIISVPVNPAFASLNLAQCVLLVAYEWRRQGAVVPPDLPDRAEVDDVGRLIDHLVGELDGAGFFFPDHKRDSMVSNLNNLLRRAPLTNQDVRTLWGVVRALTEGPKRRR
ncbi:MAG: RNA methyltransferase [Pseudomonadota bacterium]